MQKEKEVKKKKKSVEEYHAKDGTLHYVRRARRAHGPHIM